MIDNDDIISRLKYLLESDQLISFTENINLLTDKFTQVDLRLSVIIPKDDLHIYTGESKLTSGSQSIHTNGYLHKDISGEVSVKKAETIQECKENVNARQ